MAGRGVLRLWLAAALGLGALAAEVVVVRSVPEGGAAGAGAANERLDNLIAQTDVARQKLASAPPLIISLARKHDAELLEYFLDREKSESREVDLEQADDNGATALWHATMDLRLPILSVLLQRGAKVDVQKRPSGLSPLMVAAMAGDMETTRLILEAGAVMDLASSDAGATALTMCLQSGQADMAEFLLGKGASIDLTMRAWKFLLMLLMRSERDVDQRCLQVVAAHIAAEGDEVNLDRFRRFEDSVFEMSQEAAKEAGGGKNGGALEDWDEDFFPDNADADQEATKQTQDEL